MHEDESLWDLLLSPAHMGSEVITHLVIEALLALVLLPLLRKYVRREHNKIDAEHGVDNHGTPRYRITYRYEAGTGRGDDKNMWTCSCGYFTLHKASADAHLLLHKEN